MGRPKKIDDFIKDSFVEIKFTESTALNLLPGIFFKSLDDSYRYQSISLKNDPKHLNISNQFPVIVGEIRLNPEQQYIYTTDKIKMAIRPNSIIFSCKDKYISWINYKPEILNALNQLYKSGAISSFDRIGIRYINEFPNKILKDISNLEFSYGINDITSKSFKLNTQFEINDCRILLNLQQTSDDKLKSIIDIDVISNVFNSIEMEFIDAGLEKQHEILVDIFYKVLSKKFYSSLNPQY